MDLHNFNILIHEAAVHKTVHPWGKFHQGREVSKYWVAEKEKASGYKRRYVTLPTKQNNRKKVAKYLRTGIYLIVAPGEAIYVPTSHVGFMPISLLFQLKNVYFPW